LEEDLIGESDSSLLWAQQHKDSLLVECMLILWDGLIVVKEKLLSSFFFDLLELSKEIVLFI